MIFFDRIVIVKAVPRTKMLEANFFRRINRGYLHQRKFRIEVQANEIDFAASRTQGDHDSSETLLLVRILPKESFRSPCELVPSSLNLSRVQLFSVSS